MLEVSRLYDAYVYNSFLKTCSIDDDEDELKIYLDGLYHAIETALEQYDFFAGTIRELKDTYLEPAFMKLMRSPRALQGEYDFEKAKGTAEASIEDPNAPGMSLPSRTVQQALSRPVREDSPLTVAVRRMRRQHTL